MAIGRVLQSEIQEAVEALRAGELVAFPTETVYGLGANANNPAVRVSCYPVTVEQGAIFVALS